MEFLFFKEIILIYFFLKKLILFNSLDMWCDLIGPPNICVRLS